MKFDVFQREVTAAGLLVRQCSDSHWQIRGGKAIVNFYPATRRGDVMNIAGKSGESSSHSSICNRRRAWSC